MSKLTDERTTPDELFNWLNRRFGFKRDLAATKENSKLPLCYTKEDSALNKEWVDSNFCNPPYSNIYLWLQKGSQSKALIVYILPCDTSTQWWHNFIWDQKTEEFRKGIKVLFPKGRFKFGKYTTSPKFATLIVIMDNRTF